MWLFTVILGAIVIWLFTYWENSYYKFWKKQGIPYINSSPFRLLYDFLFTKSSIMDIMVNNYKKLDGHKFGAYFQVFTPSIMIRDADLIHRICIKDFSYFVDRNLASDVTDLFTESVGSLTGDRWRTLRHKMTPSFTSGKLKMMFDPIKENCEEVVEFINNKIGQDIEARDFMFKFVINVIGNVSFGLKVDALNEATQDTNQFLAVSRSFFKPSFMLMVKFMITMTMPKVRKVIKFSVVEEKVDTFFRSLVKDMIEYRERNGEVRNDFLQMLLDQQKKEQADMNSEPALKNKKFTPSGNEHAEDPEDTELFEQLKNMQNGNDLYTSTKVFTEECIISQTFMFISAGSETTAAALCFILFELSLHPHLQEKVRQEVVCAVSKNGFNYNAVKQMTYMEQFMMETMRLHTIAAFLNRVCTQNYNIPGTDIVLEKGTVLSLPLIGILNDPQIFPEPEKFDPDRFEDMNSLHPGTLLQFGIGPRMCIAKRLAMLQMKVLIATILQKFVIKASPKTKLPLKFIKASGFQHVEGGVWVQFEKRTT